MPKGSNLPNMCQVGCNLLLLYRRWIKAFALNFIKPNCAIVYEFTSGVYLKQKYCYKCANDMLVIHYIGDIREWQ